MQVVPQRYLFIVKYQILHARIPLNFLPSLTTSSVLSFLFLFSPPRPHGRETPTKGKLLREEGNLPPRSPVKS